VLHAPGPDITHGPRTRQAVALTFHGAGDVTILRRMLAEFDDAKAKITVLAIGQWLAADPQVARMVLDGGHDLGNHTWSHQTMPRLSASTTKTEIGRAAAELRKLVGGPGSWFRPSGTPHSTPTIRSAAVAAGYGACLGYDVDPLDYTDPGPNAVVRAFTASVRPGSIVSLHLGHPGTLAAMPRLLTHLHDRGLAAVTASDLLGHR
jgi:peptidoglycan/xylan/chitin deacetylase (PgdA/CDA1 family)